MKERCEHYLEKTRRVRVATITGRRDPAEPVFETTKKCTHPESRFEPGTLTGNVPCDGDKERCALPEDLR